MSNRRTGIMWKTSCVVFVIGIVLNGVLARSLDEQSQEDVGIVGGDEVNITQYPYQVSLVLRGGHHCGGSIISEEYVLTAAHCVYGNSEEYQIRAGSSYRQGGVLYDVESIVPHPDFGNYDHDIAVIKVAGKIEINGETTAIVKLADAGSKLSVGDLVTVSGWGDTTGQGHYSNVLKATTLPVYDKEKCYKAWQKYNITITDNMVCAGFKEPGQSACYGDSGGPLVDKNYVQHGIVSFGGPGCQKYDLPNGYASVASFRAWIQEKTGV